MLNLFYTTMQKNLAWVYLFTFIELSVLKTNIENLTFLLTLTET